MGEKEGVLEFLTKQLVKLYEETDKPENALDYLKNNVVGSQPPINESRIEELEKENSSLKEKIKVLEAEKKSWLADKPEEKPLVPDSKIGESKAEEEKAVKEENKAIEEESMDVEEETKAVEEENKAVEEKKAVEEENKAVEEEDKAVEEEKKDTVSVEKDNEVGMDAEGNEDKADE